MNKHCLKVPKAAPTPLFTDAGDLSEDERLNKGPVRVEREGNYMLSRCEDCLRVAALDRKIAIVLTVCNPPDEKQ